MNKYFGLCLILAVLCGIKLTKTEIFTTLFAVKGLFETEYVIINYLDEYPLVQERKIKVEEYNSKGLHQVAGRNVTLDGSNRIKASLLIKRLESDFRYLQDWMPHHYNNSNTDAELKMLIELRDSISHDNHYEKAYKTIEYDSENDTCQNWDEKIYNMMCRGELKPTPRQIRRLRCHYVTNNVAFLKIAPLKRETASISPFIVIYHEVMYDNEIELVKEMAKPRLMPLHILDTQTGLTKSRSVRFVKIGRIKNEQDQTIQIITQRTEDMTGLNMETAEKLQVSSYGIGGHFLPHYDSCLKYHKKCLSDTNGNRIATVLFYMSDAEQGGATVFPVIKTIIFPKKGTAVFWYNLYASGEVDYRTKHAACPVLTGSKWVSNKWISERGQEFIRQCNIIPDHPTHLKEWKV